MRRNPPLWTLPAAGFAATAMTYGPARMGFGLFLTDFRATFSLSTEMAGLVSGLGFFGFLLGLLGTGAMTARYGPRSPVLLGLAAAILGMGLIAAAPNLPVLATGVFFAMSSPGFTWAPFNDAVHRRIEDEARPRALSVISTGTSLGIAAAGVTALGLSAAGLSWRVAWVGFAVAAALALAANRIALQDGTARADDDTAWQWSILMERSALPLYGVALSFGTTSAIFISFAAERIAQAGGLPGLPANAAAAIVFIFYGLAGLLGLATGRARSRLGLGPLLGLLMLASALSLAFVGLTPTSWIGVGLAAALQGIFVMMMSATLAFWSERLFPERPAPGFTAVLLFVALGGVLGPVATGFAAAAFGLGPVFVGTAAIPGITAVFVRSHHLHERAGAT